MLPVPSNDDQTKDNTGDTVVDAVAKVSRRVPKTDLLPWRAHA